MGRIFVKSQALWSCSIYFNLLWIEFRLFSICWKKEGRRWPGSRFAVTAGREVPVLVDLLAESLRWSLMSQRKKFGHNFVLGIIFFKFISYNYLQLFLLIPTVFGTSFFNSFTLHTTRSTTSKPQSYLIDWYSHSLSTLENYSIPAEWKELNQTGQV